MAHTRSVEEVVEKKEKNIQNACLLQKQERMSKGQRAGAVRRKQAKANTGPTPSRAATFAKRQKKMAGGYIGPAINSSYDGVTLNNPSYSKYYKGII